MIGSDVYIRGRLIDDSELVIFGDSIERSEAMYLLREKGFSVRHEPQYIALFTDIGKLAKYLKKFLGKELILGISRGDAKRSNRQLRFYFGVIVHGIKTFWYNETGTYYTKEQIHLDNLLNIWGWKPVEEVINGRSIIRMDKMPSTGDMSVEDFTAFIKMIEVEYAEKGLDWTEYIDEGDGTLNQYYEAKYGH